MCFKFFEGRIKGLNFWDIKCIKLSMFFFTFVLIKGVRIIWEVDLLNLLSIWWWLVLMIVFAIKPIYKICYKKNEGTN